MSHKTEPGSSPRYADRSQGLNPTEADLLREAGQNLMRNEPERASNLLDELLESAPDHPEALRLKAIVMQYRGRPADAVRLLVRATGLWPQDALLQNNLGAVLRDGGDRKGALVAFRKACELDPELAAAWLNLGMTLLGGIEVDQAEAALARAVRLEPRHFIARIGHAHALGKLGRTDTAIAEYRAALATEPAAVDAWAGIAELRSSELDDTDLATLEALQARTDLPEDSRAKAGFALSRALDDRQDHARAFAVATAANALRARQHPWNRQQFSAQVDAIMEAFDKPLADASEPPLGNEAIFVLGMPNSGSSMLDAILGAHPDVQPAGELSDLMSVIQEETNRRGGQPFPGWVAATTQADWQRMGRRYLERTAGWRQVRPRHLDNSPANWTVLGALLAMLPGARVVFCRRDPLETCCACFLQAFARGQHIYACDLDDLAAYRADHDRLMAFWHQRFATSIHELAYEELMDASQADIRHLLEYCRLDFEPGCLAPQVPLPMRKNNASAARYGTLLNPLRDALARASQA